MLTSPLYKQHVFLLLLVVPCNWGIPRVLAKYHRKACGMLRTKTLSSLYHSQSMDNIIVVRIVSSGNYVGLNTIKKFDWYPSIIIICGDFHLIWVESLILEENDLVLVFGINFEILSTMSRSCSPRSCRFSEKGVSVNYCISWSSYNYARFFWALPDSITVSCRVRISSCSHLGSILKDKKRHLEEQVRQAIPWRMFFNGLFSEGLLIIRQWISVGA